MAAKKSSKKAGKKKAAPKKKAAKKSAPKKKAAAKKAAAPKSPKKAAAKKKAAPKKATAKAVDAPIEAEAVVVVPVAEVPVAEVSATAPAATETAAPEAAATEKPSEKPSETAATEAAATETPAPAASPKPKKKAAPEVVEEEEPEPELPPIPKMPARKAGVITLSYGASADQAFMIYGLANEKVDTEDRTYEFTRKDLEALTGPASRGKPDVTSFSFGAYPKVQNRYLLLACGASFGDHQGPILVSRTPIRAGEVSGLPVAVPSELHTAALALRLWLPRAKLKFVEMPTAHISLMIRAGKIRSGVLVNEDQITYRDHNLVRVVDLGHWWGEETEGLPLAVSAMGIRRDIEEDERAKIALDLKRSIAYALGHREEALEWAAQFAKKRAPETLDKYVSRYVNDLSLDSGERGRQALNVLFERAHRNGVLKDPIHTFYS